MKGTFWYLFLLLFVILLIVCICCTVHIKTKMQLCLFCTILSVLLPIHGRLQTVMSQNIGWALFACSSPLVTDWKESTLSNLTRTKTRMTSHLNQPLPPNTAHSSSRAQRLVSHWCYWPTPRDTSQRLSSMLCFATWLYERKYDIIPSECIFLTFQIGSQIGPLWLDKCFFCLSFYADIYLNNMFHFISNLYMFFSN